MNTHLFRTVVLSVLLTVIASSVSAQGVRVGDMLFPVATTSNGVSSPSASLGIGDLDQIEAWANGEVPLDTTRLTDRRRGQLFAACAEWTKVASGVRCVERNPDQFPYVMVTSERRHGTGRIFSAWIGTSGSDPRRSACMNQQDREELAEKLGDKFAAEIEKATTDGKLSLVDAASVCRLISKQLTARAVDLADEAGFDTVDDDDGDDDWDDDYIDDDY